ncbi:Serine/threonine-protein kinase [Mycobacterium lentiflavum]|uniref:Serine/threonine-protein kinase n=1 Tax=Mycobacterium lentiflavum TaxID=141349 RepID=A0A0E4GZ56_MYCLN|nr:NHL repeat-containing protein [Mycobacterium lentiflavum]CQD16936.1 Serine/threonine-protein kinase [Mycobacterium lentiflavum]
MTKTVLHQWWIVWITAATIAAVALLAACSTSTAPQSISSAPTTGQPSSCEVNPSSVPMPSAEPMRPVPAVGRISVALTGITSGIVKPGGVPAEVDVTLCNNSAVDYPKVGVVLVLERCSCATNPMGLPEGTVERFDPATGGWIEMDYPVIGTGMDYLGTFANVQALPKGKAVTLRYRVALDHSMTAGKGGVEATVVTPDPLVQIGKASLPFTVLKESTTPSSAPIPAGRQTLLPFPGVTYPRDIAVDGQGNVYVTDSWNGRVLKLAVGASEPMVLPFAGLAKPGGVAVDGAGDVFVADAANNRVLELLAGSNQQTVLPFTGLDSPGDVAVDGHGNVYVTDNKVRVIKLASGSHEQTVLPFTGLRWPGGLAVDGAGNVFVFDPSNKRILTLASGSDVQTVLSVGSHGGSIAVDPAGAVYLCDSENKRVLKYPAGSKDGTELPFTGLNGPTAVAVDGAGNVYVLDRSGFGQVVKLAVG